MSTQVKPLTESPAAGPATSLTNEEILRYSRHLIMPEVGMEGQLKLKNAKVLLIGTGGLGAPLGLYLAAAGVGKLGLVDFDVVDFTNLQRQIAFRFQRRRQVKAKSAQSAAFRSESRHSRSKRTRRNSKAATRSNSSRTTTSSSMAPTISPRAISSTTRASCSANRMCTARSSASRDRSPCSECPMARATAACIPNRLRRDSFLRARKAVFSACFPESSARFRRWKRSS